MWCSGLLVGGCCVCALIVLVFGSLTLVSFYVVVVNFVVSFWARCLLIVVLDVDWFGVLVACGLVICVV